MPINIVSTFIELGMEVALFFADAAILFGLIRGGTAVLKIASKFFGAAGA
jgi:hypothetical protein